jgi:Tfp pilus assembly protein PilF
MTSLAGRTDRDVVPRWRSVTDTLAAGEFAPLRHVEAVALSTAHLDRLDDEWQAEQSEAFASDFVGGALVAGVPEQAQGAAEFLARNGSTARLKRLGLIALGSHHPPPVTTGPGGMERSGVRVEIARLKKAVGRDPRNALAWAELARHYTAWGQRRHAERAIRNALGVAPENRYLLRSAACFFVHSDPRQGHDLLLGASGLRSDPWLLAAELALSHVAGRKPRHMKAARALLDGDVRPMHLTELRSQVATLELRAGSDKKARRMFVDALIEPTDNSVAQVEWASRQMTGLQVQESLLAIPLASEARARHALEAGDWKTATENAELWLGDQPFSDDAASLASYVASNGLRDWQLGEQFARRGLRANPGNRMLLNNLAYCLLEQDRVEEARDVLSHLRLSETHGQEEMAALATHGLLAFRSGDPATGRRLYERAIAKAKSLGLPDRHAFASVLLAREEIRAGTPEAAEALYLAERFSRGISDKAVNEWLAEVARAASGSIPRP